MTTPDRIRHQMLERQRERCNAPLVPLAVGDIRCALLRGHREDCQPSITDLPLLHEIVEKARETNPEWFDG